MAAHTALVDAIDAVLGAHVGSYPQFAWHCPHCSGGESDASKPKLGVNVERGVAHCWRCGFACRNLRYLFPSTFDRLDSALLDRVSIVGGSMDNDALYARVLCDFYAANREASADDLRHVALPVDFVPASKWVAHNIRKPQLYVASRDYTMMEAISARLGYCVGIAGGLFTGRIIFPVWMNGACVYHTNRYALDPCPAAAKTKNVKRVEGCHSAGSVLLGYDEVKGKKSAAVVEGPFSWMAARRVMPSVATLGKHITKRQRGLFGALVEAGLEEVVLARDPDADWGKNYEDLKSIVPRVRVATFDDGDPDDEKDRVRKIFATAASDHGDIFARMIERKLSVKAYRPRAPLPTAVVESNSHFYATIADSFKM